MARTEQDFATTRIEDLADPSGDDANNALPGGCYEEDAPGEPIPENTGIVVEDDSFPTEDDPHPHDPIPENTGIVVEDDSFPTEDDPHDPIPENTGIVAEDDSFPTEDDPHDPHDPHGEIYSIVAEDDGFPTEDLPFEHADGEAYQAWRENLRMEVREMVERGGLRDDVTTMAFGEGDDAPDTTEPVIVDDLPEGELPPEVIFEEQAPVTEPVIVDDLPEGEPPPELIDVDPEVTEPVIVDDVPEDGPPELIFVAEEPAPVTEPLVVDELPEDLPPELIDVDPPVDDWADVAL